MSCVRILWRHRVTYPVSVYCDGVGRYALCLYTGKGWGVMPCVCILDGMGCRALCLYTVTGWDVMSCVCIPWRAGSSCPAVSVYYNGVGCYVCILWQGKVSCQVKGWGVMSCVRMLWRSGLSCPVSVYYCDRVSAMCCVCTLWQGGWYGLCPHAMTGWVVMSCVCTLWQGWCHAMCLRVM